MQLSCTWRMDLFFFFKGANDLHGLSVETRFQVSAMGFSILLKKVMETNGLQIWGRKHKNEKENRK